MTNANLPDRWLLDTTFDNLSDAAWRIYTYSLMYGNQQGTDGLLKASAVRFLHPVQVPPAAIDELVEAGLWQRLAGGEYQVTRWAQSQSTAAQVEQNRENARVRSAAYRAGRKRASDTNSSPDTSRVTSPETPETRQDQFKTSPDQEVLPREDEVAEPEYKQAWRSNPPQKRSAAA